MPDLLESCKAPPRRRAPAGGWPTGCANEEHKRLKARSVVYYMRLGNRVKIGFTTDIKQRLANIGAEAAA